MKNITIYILLLCSSLSSIAQNAPTWTSTDACLDTYIGSISLEFDHDLVEFPLPYESSYYNNTAGDFEEIMITSSPRIKKNNLSLAHNSQAIMSTSNPLYPTQIELANDDPAETIPNTNGDAIDEDEDPIMPTTTTDRIFSYDIPSEIKLGSSKAFSVRRLNFEEFARVSFGITLMDI